MSIAGVLRCGFAEQTQGPERGIVEAELLGKGGFKGAPRLALKGAVGGQPFKARFGKFPER